MRWLKKIFKQKKPLVYRQLRMPLSDDEILMALRIPESHPVYAAMLEIFDRELSAQLAVISDPALADKPGALAHASGGIEKLSDLVIELQTWRQSATEKPIQK